MVGLIAPDVAVLESRDISGELKTRLPDIVGASFYAELHKATDRGETFIVEVMTGGSGYSEDLKGEDLNKFKDLVQQANYQLQEAKFRGYSETFLILLDLLYYLVPTPDAVRNTFSQLNAEEYSNINYAYLVQSSVTRVKP